MHCAVCYDPMPAGYIPLGQFGDCCSKECARVRYHSTVLFNELEVIARRIQDGLFDLYNARR